MDMTLAGVVAAATLAVTIFQAANSRTGAYTAATRAIEMAKKLGDELDRTDAWPGRDKVQANRLELLRRANYATQEYLDMTVPKRMNVVEAGVLVVIFGILTATSVAPMAFPAGFEFLRWSAAGVFAAAAALTARQVRISWRRIGVEEALKERAELRDSAEENEPAGLGPVTVEKS
jgi:hypothetical protein